MTETDAALTPMDLGRPVWHTLVASDVMTRDVITSSPHASVFAALEALTGRRIHHVPLVTETGHCVEILDTATAIRRLTRAWSEEAVPVADPAPHDGPLSVLPETPLQHVAVAMDSAFVDACCVVDSHGRMLGLITARDIVAAVSRGRPRSGISR